MHGSALLSEVIEGAAEQTAAASKNSIGRIVMSCANYANIDNAIVNPKVQNRVARPKPALVRPPQESFADWAARRVNEVVDLVLANGSLPA